MCPDTAPTERAARLDEAGALASALCAVHCAVVALAPGLLMAVGLGGLISHEVEWITTAVAILIGLLAGLHGFRKHGSWGLLAGFIAMATALVAVRFLDAWLAGATALPALFAVLAGGGMAWMHVLNIRSTRACRSHDRAPSRP